MAGRHAAALAFLEESLVATDCAPPAALQGAGRDDGAGLRKYLLQQYKVGKMSATAVAQIAWHATRAGAVGVADLAFDPQISHKHAELLAQAISTRAAATFYDAGVPLWSHAEEYRFVSSFPMNLPHEEFARQHASNPTDFQIANQEDPQVPPTYFEHPVYKEKGAQACPVGYFSDAVPHTKRDSFFALYWSNCLTGTRYLICSVRKKDICQCGCKGQCTMGAILRVVSWSFRCLAEGSHPQLRHDGSRFLLSDCRHARRGQPLAGGYCGAMVEMRADLLEFVGACGFKTWADTSDPCFCCTAEKDDMFNFPPSIAASTWQDRDAATYDEQVQEALVHRRLEAGQDGVLARLIEHMHFDTRPKGFGGLVLKADFPELRLTKGMRLLEDGPVVDLHQVADIRTPCTLSFFDCCGNHGLNFLCPLFSIPGFTIEALCLDVMHVLDLGVTQYLIGAVFRELIENNFCGSDFIYVDMRRTANLKALRVRLRTYYRGVRRERGRMTCIGRLSMPMLGPVANPRLKAKAAESRNLVPLLSVLCDEHPTCLGERGVFLKMCCLHLNSFYETMQVEGRQMTSGGLHQLRSSMFRFLTCWKSFGGHCVPKHHFAWHLAQRASTQGNPRFYWTYADEQENRVMGSVAKSLHGGNTFYLTFLQKVLPEVCA